MEINSELHDFVAQTDASMRGDVVYIPNQLERVGPIFNLMQSRFTLVGGMSGTGKSSYVDDVFILKPWQFMKNLDDFDIHWEILYYSMERKKMFKHAKWMSWLLYQSKGWQLDADTLMGWGANGTINKIVREEYDKQLDNLADILDHTDIYDGRISVGKVAKQITKRARELGTLYKADDVGVMRDSAENYIATFTDDKFVQTKHGKVKYVDLEHNGQKFRLQQGKHKYITKHPHTFLFIVIDGIGIVDTTGYKGTKEAIDALVNLLADARDIYGFSPIIVSQFNRGITDIHRMKLHGGANEPQESDFKDSGNQYQAADLVIGLFDPVKAKAYDDKGLYQGYDVLKGFKSQYGAYRFRSFKVLKNSFGIDNASFPMVFRGEVNHFEVAPLASDEENMARLYMRLQAGK